ncbi:hypothetical protein EC973_007629 [Apophysomyces ossiformis]|uniref:Crinkler effector protein N-terminal domain-containing protein n=1 Tax=Apophysomyces ossiformis TaxID=679940 RepID=A0A8H7ERH4_9FUNG|nr:hypothetical protein EC973_007629 [Apophysomyces ossiformis]
MSHSSPTGIPFNLFCLVEGESMQRAFSVKVSSADTVHNLKKVIKAEKSPEFDDIDANKLTLWLVEIPITNVNRHDKVLSDNITTKEELLPSDELSDVFQGRPPKKTVHIMVQRPPSELKRGRDEEEEEDEDEDYDIPCLKRFKPNGTVMKGVRKYVYYADQAKSNEPLIAAIRRGEFVRLYGARASGKSSRIMDAMNTLTNKGYECI